MKSHKLYNCFGWTLIYTVTGADVTIHRRYCGSEVGSVRLGIVAARCHYQSQKARGFVTARHLAQRAAVVG